MIYIYAYKPGSRSAYALSRILRYPLIRHQNSRFKGQANKTVINWGSTEIPDDLWKEINNCVLINDPEVVKVAANKHLFYEVLKDTKDLTPKFTTTRQNALEWLRNGSRVLARSVLNGHSGAGITLIEREEDLIDAPLYVKYVKKVDEYRVHVFKGQVIDVQRKARRLDIPDSAVNWAIRNHDNGFIFARGNVGPDQIVYYQRLCDSAVKCVQRVGLDFGAVDLIYNQKKDRVYVLEVNTAPGLEGTTLARYAEAFRGLRQ